MVQYYCELWPKCSDILAPLTELTKGGPTKNGPTEWATSCTESFQQIKSLIVKDTIPTYPDLSKSFTIHIDASGVKLGAVTMQESKPLTF